MASYENHMRPHPTNYASTSASSDRPRPALNERSVPNHHVFNPTSRCSVPTQAQAQAHQQPLPLPQVRVPSSSTVSSNAPSQQSRQKNSRQSTRHSTPSSGGQMGGKELSARDSAMVLHSLQIPPCIRSRGGSLPDFVADVTGLLWFESVQVLEAAEHVRSLPPNATVRRLSKSAVACPGFKKWVQGILQTTQVTQNVVLLALLYIYRLKMINPTVNGRPGSEYRLLTVALMLGNKFLDDNTYTNKTWADVSGINVKDIHVMEVEFLSNMRYGLYASREHWEEWLVKLNKFSEYLDMAQRQSSPSPLMIPSPTHQSSSATNQIAPSPSALGGNSPAYGSSGTSSAWSQSFSANAAISPLSLKPDSSATRKRSFPEVDPTDPPAKRVNQNPVLPSVSQPHQVQPAPVQPQSLSVHQMPRLGAQGHFVSQQPHPAETSQQRRPSSALPEQARLSVPHLTLNTSHAINSHPVSSQPYASAHYAPSQASNLSLPPLVPSVRAMSTVYPTATTYSSQPAVVATCGPSMSSSVAVVTPTTAFPPPINYATPTKRLSPQNPLSRAAPYQGSSPLNESFPNHSLTPMAHGGASGTHTPISHSPSVYLQQRDSPYKPVRHVNTLLYPPPSAFLQQYHFPNPIPPTQMHYQHLGRRNDLRTGIVPEFAMYGAGRHHADTPASGYRSGSPVLPNPHSHARPSYAPMQGRAVTTYPGHS